MSSKQSGHSPIFLALMIGTTRRRNARSIVPDGVRPIVVCGGSLVLAAQRCSVFELSGSAFVVDVGSWPLRVHPLGNDRLRVDLMVSAG